MKNLLASIAAASIVFAAVVANAATAPAPVAPTPPAAACAKRTVIDNDGTIHIVSRCVIVSK